jgi:hypothetical protein
MIAATRDELRRPGRARSVDLRNRWCRKNAASKELAIDGIFGTPYKPTQSCDVSLQLASTVLLPSGAPGSSVAWFFLTRGPGAESTRSQRTWPPRRPPPRRPRRNPPKPRPERKGRSSHALLPIPFPTESRYNSNRPGILPACLHLRPLRSASACAKQTGTRCVASTAKFSSVCRGRKSSRQAAKTQSSAKTEEVVN